MKNLRLILTGVIMAAAMQAEQPRNLSFPDLRLAMLPESREFAHPAFSTTFGDDFFYEASYDKFTDYTTVFLLLRLQTGSQDDLFIGANYFTTQGELPDNVTLRILALSRAPQFENGSNLILMIDGQRVFMGEMARKVSTIKGLCTETLQTELSLEAFAELFTAQAIEGKLWVTKFKLDDRQMEAFRHFLALMAQNR